MSKKDRIGVDGIVEDLDELGIPYFIALEILERRGALKAFAYREAVYRMIAATCRALRKWHEGCAPPERRKEMIKGGDTGLAYLRSLIFEAETHQEPIRRNRIARIWRKYATN